MKFFTHSASALNSAVIKARKKSNQTIDMSQPTEDGIIVTFNEFMEHLQKHMEELKSEVVTNDRLYTAEDFPKLKAVVVEAGMCFDQMVISSQQNGEKRFQITPILF